MTSWIRLGLAFAVAVAAALFLKALPPIVVLVLFVGGMAALNLTLRGRARGARSNERDAGSPSSGVAPRRRSD